MSENHRLSILSLGYTRSLWDRRESNDNVRLRAYGAALRRYTFIVNSRRKHALPPLEWDGMIEAVATNGWTSLDNGLRMLWLGHQFLRRQRYDVIQAQDPAYLGMVALLLGRRHRLPVNVCVYGPDPFSPAYLQSSRLNRCLAPIARHVLQHCEGIQVDGRLGRESLILNGIAAGKIALKPMIPSDVNAFLALGERSREVSPVVRLLFVGRLVRQKNLGSLIRAIARVRSSELGLFQLRLVGDGPLRESLERQVAAAGLSDFVEFVGQVDRAQILRVFSETDIFVLSSFYEGYPRVLVEAAAAGLPIVSTRVGGADEIIVDGQTGFVVPVNDDDRVTMALRELLCNSSLRRRMGGEAHARMKRLVAEAASPAEQIRIWERVGGRTPHDS